MEIADWVSQANTRINDYVRRTPLEYSPYISELTGANVYLKLENYQLTGSFKIRGAMNKVLALSTEIAKQGVVTASTGNHAAAVAYATKLVDTKAIIFMPETVSEIKVKNLSYFSNVEIVIAGKDSVDSELEALDYARQQKLTYISPYNDKEIISGQGTIAIEILEDLPKPDHVLVPVGGGGLIAGIAGYLKEMSPLTSIVGCQPENSAVMYHSLTEGHVLTLESKPTISDGTAGGLETNSITFPLCQNYIDDFHLVSEEEILSALKLLVEQHYMLVEGAAGLSVASVIKNKHLYANKNIVLILCGNKMSRKLLPKVLQNK